MRKEAAYNARWMGRESGTPIIIEGPNDEPAIPMVTMMMNSGNTWYLHPVASGRRGTMATLPLVAYRAQSTHGFGDSRLPIRHCSRLRARTSMLT